VIWVEGNFAYANYYFEQTVLAKDGKKTTTNNRWLDVLIKRNGKWLLLAEYGSAYTPL
jgi:ketosteroid isomerase-like protein